MPADSRSPRFVPGIIASLSLTVLCSASGCSKEVAPTPPAKVASNTPAPAAETVLPSAPTEAIPTTPSDSSSTPPATPNPEPTAPAEVPSDSTHGTEAEPLTVAQLQKTWEEVLLPNTLKALKTYRSIKQIVIAKVSIDNVYANHFTGQATREPFLRFSIPGLAGTDEAELGPKVKFTNPEDLRDLVPGQEIVISGRAAASFDSGEIEDAKILSRGPVPPNTAPPIAPLSDAELKDSLKAIEDQPEVEGAKVSITGRLGHQFAALELNDLKCVTPEGLPTDAVLGLFAKVKNIEEIQLKIPVGAKFLEKLAQFPSLTSLIYDLQTNSDSDTEAKPAERALSGLSTWPHLSTLHLTGAYVVTDLDLEHIAALPGIRKLDLFPTHPRSRQQITKSGLESLAKSPTLRQIRIQLADQIDDEAIAALAKLKRLYELHVENNKITGPGIVALAACPELTHLNLRCGQLTDESLQAMAAQKWPSLQMITLNYSRVTDAGLIPLLTSGLKLREFQCDGPGVTEASLIAFAKSGSTAQLTAFSLPAAAITDASLKALLQKPLPKMEFLFLKDSKVTDAGIKEIEQLKTLKALSLPTETVSEEAKANLKKAMPTVMFFN